MRRKVLLEAVCVCTMAAIIAILPYYHVSWQAHGSAVGVTPTRPRLTAPLKKRRHRRSSTSKGEDRRDVCGGKGHGTSFLSKIDLRGYRACTCSSGRACAAAPCRVPRAVRGCTQQEVSGVNNGTSIISVHKSV